jgi:hypothetical protein
MGMRNESEWIDFGAWMISNNSKFGHLEILFAIEFPVNAGIQ